MEKRIQTRLKLYEYLKEINKYLEFLINPLGRKLRNNSSDLDPYFRLRRYMKLIYSNEDFKKLTDEELKDFAKIMTRVVEDEIKRAFNLLLFARSC